LHIERLYADALVAVELALSEKQIAEFRDVHARFEEDAAKVLGLTTNPGQVEKLLKELAASRRRKAEAILTPEQNAKLKSMIGEPFTVDSVAGHPFFSLFRIGDPAFLAISQCQREVTFGKYVNELDMLVANQLVQQELKLTDSQIEEFTKRLGELPRVRLSAADQSAIDYYIKQMAKRSEAIERTLNKVFASAQAKRFRQIMIRERNGIRVVTSGMYRYLIESAAAYPGVAEELKLRDEQRQELIGGKSPEKVLTEQQKSAIEKMLGEAFGDESATRRPSFVFYATGFLEDFVTGQNRLFAPALKLTADQSKSLEAVRQAYREAPPRNGTPFPVRSKSEYQKTAIDILTTEQKSRLAQLEIQKEAAFDLAKVLTGAKMAWKLSLTHEQIDKLKDLRNDAAKLQMLRTAHISSVQGSRLAIRMRNGADERMMAVLTADQRKRWNELTGEPLIGLVKHIPDPSRDIDFLGGLGDQGSFGGFREQFGQ
jgi:Spy/CpxP family protein refolding chaperone